MKSILIIDDDTGISEALKLILTEEGFSVESSGNGKNLFKKDAKLPDLILLDLLLSGINGTEIVKKLKKQDNTRTIPIIMMSAHPKAEISVKDAGADDFIAKPFELNDLLLRMNRLLKTN